MKHVDEYENLNERKLKMKFQSYNIDNDNFIREVWCKKHAPKFLIEGQKYRLYSEFETGAMISGKCFVVLTDNNHFIGFDSGYFLEEYQWEAEKKYNL